MKIKIEQGLDAIILEVDSIEEAVKLHDMIMPYCKRETTINISVSELKPKEGVVFG